MNLLTGDKEFFASAKPDAAFSRRFKAGEH
jgi:hypothetical protein